MEVDIEGGLGARRVFQRVFAVFVNGINIGRRSGMSEQKILIGDLISRYAAGERDFSEVIIKTPFPEVLSWQPGQFKGLDLSGIILRDSSIRWIRIYMAGVILRGADLTNVDLGESNFEGADLSNAILCGTQFWQSVFERANFNGADLSGASLCDSEFFCANLSRVNLSNARLKGLDFVRTNLTEATFNEASLKSVSFEKAKLIRTNFRFADFGPNNDSIFSVKFRDCRFEDTLMPDGSVLVVKESKSP